MLRGTACTAVLMGVVTCSGCVIPLHSVRASRQFSVDSIQSVKDSTAHAELNSGASYEVDEGMDVAPTARQFRQKIGDAAKQTGDVVAFASFAVYVYTYSGVAFLLTGRIPIEL